MPSRLFAVSGNTAYLITRTYEVLHGSNGILNDADQVELNDDGSFSVDFDGGGTDIDWNSQEAVDRGNGRIFLDEDGDEWDESDLELLEVDDDGEPIWDEENDEFVQAGNPTKLAEASDEDEDDPYAVTGSVRRV